MVSSAHLVKIILFGVAVLVGVGLLTGALGIPMLLSPAVRGGLIGVCVVAAISLVRKRSA